MRTLSRILAIIMILVAAGWSIVAAVQYASATESPNRILRANSDFDPEKITDEARSLTAIEAYRLYQDDLTRVLALENATNDIDTARIELFADLSIAFVVLVVASSVIYLTRKSVTPTPKTPDANANDMSSAQSK